jgi:hypothetical protein
MRWDDQRERDWGELVRDGAVALSQRLGYRPPPGELENQLAQRLEAGHERLRENL